MAAGRGGVLGGHTLCANSPILLEHYAHQCDNGCLQLVPLGWVKVVGGSPLTPIILEHAKKTRDECIVSEAVRKSIWHAALLDKCKRTCENANVGVHVSAFCLTPPWQEA